MEPAEQERVLASGETALRRVATLVAEGASSAQILEAVEATRDALALLVDEQAALRRVATLVARGMPPVDVFVAVCEEARRILGCEAAGFLRFEPDGTAATLIAQSETPWDPPPLGTRFTLDGDNFVTRVFHTGRAVRVDDWGDSTGSVAAMATVLGVRSAVASPVVVEGLLWGTLIAASSKSEPLPVDMEPRLGEFTELIATAIANADARGALSRLAEEQAALRRVAVFVARQPSPEEIFAAVAEAVGSVVGADVSAVVAFPDDVAGTVVGTWSREGPVLAVGTDLPLDTDSAVARIFHSGAAARIDGYTTGAGAEIAKALGVRSTVGAPILVAGKLWGALAAAMRGEVPLPEDAESRVAAFTELVATAISNAQARDALALLADEQAALRRVATIVASGRGPEDVFSAVAVEVGALFGSDVSAIVRFESDGTATVLGDVGGPHRAGTRVTLDPGYVVHEVRETGRSARYDTDEPGVADDGTLVRSLGVRSAVASPIVVEGELWGAITAASVGGALPPGAERHLSEFTELIATAISNTQARGRVTALADEQAALRRVATLVALEASQGEIFNAITEGVAGALGEELRLVRFEGDHAVIVATSEGPNVSVLPVGTRLPLGGSNALSHVFRTGEPIRIDDYSRATGPIAEAVRAQDLRSIVATPIVVEGRTWGAMIVGTFGDVDPVPPGTEGRLGQFAELMATSIANTEARAEIERLAEQEAALRRIATLVARGVEPDELFAAVTDETAATFNAITAVMRFEHDPPENVIVGVSKETGIPLGTRWPLAEGMTSTEVFRTGRPARLGTVDWAAHPGPVAEAGLRFGVMSQVGCPIVVEGSLWGVITLNASEELPADTEQRLEKFTELVTTAIANTQSRGDLRRLAEQQAALRRVATLVARRDAPQMVFEAVAAEAGGLLGADIAGLVRFESDDTVTVMAGPPPGPFSTGDRVALDPAFVVYMVRETGRPARFETDDPTAEGMPDLVRRFLMRSAVATPILVEGDLWGAIVLGSLGAPFATDTEQRLDEFTELVATGISNATARADLVASRARIVAAGDEARRRIERNLHDGTQQRLIALGLELQRLRAELHADPVSEAGFEHLKVDLESILEDLRELSRGLHPPLLSRVGLGPPLQALALRSEIPVQLEVDLPERPPAPVETAIYYLVSEALANATKYSHASAIRVTISSDCPDGLPNMTTLHGTVADDGVGGAEPGGGSGLIGLVDRVNALGGHLALDSPPGHGTRISFDLPVEPPVVS
jgi:GAF domain-containing protein